MANNRSVPTPSNGLVQAPEGYQRLGAVTTDLWFNLRDGNRIEGKLLGCYRMQNKRSKTGESNFFQILLTSSCECRQGRGEKAAVVTASEGSVVNLNYSKKLEVLKEYTDKLCLGGEYSMIAHCGKKKELASGNTMWDFTPFVKEVKAPRADEVVDFLGGEGDDVGGDGLEDAV